MHDVIAADIMTADFLIFCFLALLPLDYSPCLLFMLFLSSISKMQAISLHSFISTYFFFFLEHSSYHVYFYLFTSMCKFSKLFIVLNVDVRSRCIACECAMQ